MKSSRSKVASPFIIQWQFAENSTDWYRNSLDWYEMLTASATTIALRMTGIGYNIQNNEAPDSKEMMRMVSEKQKAVLTSLQAVSKWQASAASLPKWPAAAPWMAVDAGATAAGQWLSQHAKWNKMMLDGFSSTLRPFHSASTANALRLTKPKKKG